jgi:hypothetical protein
MSSIVPNADFVAFGTRALVTISCRPALRHLEACTNPLAVGTTREANGERFRIRLANSALRGSTAISNFLDANVNDYYHQSSREMLVYRKLLVEKVLMWVTVAHPLNISVTDTGSLSRS